MSLQSPPTTLPTRRLGDSEFEVSAVGLGCNNFGGRLGAEGTAAVLEAALAAGITFFDTADIYGGGGGSESLMGEALAGRRDEYVLTTKFGMEMRGAEAESAPDAPRGSREYLRWAVEGSLRRLRADRIDLYQYHEPDGVTPIAETLAALGELVDEGVVTAIGCSNFSAAELEQADRVSREQGLPRFVTLQNHYSLLERGIEPIDVAIAGLLAQPAVASVIAGATKPEQIKANVGALRWAPSAADLEELDRIAPTPRR